MVTSFPTNTVIMILVAMLGTAAAFWFSLSYALKQLPAAPSVKRNWRWGAALLLTAWLLIRLALVVNPPGGEIIAAPFIMLFIVAGISAGTLPLLFSPVFRQAIRAIPETWLVGIHAIRIVGFLFLALMDMQLLPGEFALPAGYGDLSVGLLALLTVYLLAAHKPYARAFLIVWNGLGLLDFVIALITGISSIAPFAAQVAEAGISPHYMNYVLIIPTFGVPLFALLHFYSLFQMVSPSTTELPQRIKATAEQSAAL